MKSLERPRKQPGDTLLRKPENKLLLLSDWMVTVMENGTGDDDNVCSMAAVLGMAMVKVVCYPAKNGNAMPAACDTPDKLDDTCLSSSQLLDDVWWMDDETVIRATQSVS